MEAVKVATDPFVVGEVAVANRAPLGPLRNTSVPPVGAEPLAAVTVAVKVTFWAVLAVSGETSISILAARAWETVIGGALGVAAAKLILPLKSEGVGGAV